jgi:hypothetical protein
MPSPTSTPSPTLTATVAATSTPAPPTPTATGSTNPNATLANIQTDIFSPTCADLFCHSATGQAGNLVLENGQSHDQLVGVQSFNVAARQGGLLRVKASDPDNSFLIIKLTGPTAAQGSLMPLGKPALTAAQVQLIRDWITQGALP